MMTKRIFNLHSRLGCKTKSNILTNILNNSSTAIDKK